VGAFVVLFIDTVQKLSKLPHEADGSIKVWGSPDSGGANAPTDKGYIKIYSTAYSFAALKAVDKDLTDVFLAA
jgi:hypothetical protein